MLMLKSGPLLADQVVSSTITLNSDWSTALLLFSSIKQIKLL